MYIKQRMTGKTALVTGGASGLGAAIAYRLTQEGAHVVVGDMNTENAENRTGKTTHAKLDVTEPESMEAAVERIVNDYGRLDCVVNSAGIARTMPFLDTPMDVFDNVMKVNVGGTFVVAQSAARAMKKTGGGSIVNVGSVSGEIANSLRVAYGGSKGGVHHMSRIMAVELACYNIRVNVVAPGPVATPLTDAIYTDEVRKEWLDRIPSPGSVLLRKSPQRPHFWRPMTPAS
nr:SDR family oxidoreductase [Pararhizobium polonicum]